MSKTFRSWEVEQVWLLPPSVQDFVPQEHLAHFVRELVRRELDLSAILGTYSEERGYPPYHPVMMTALLLYSYTQGIYSSRRIARACEERVDFMAITALQKPDFRTVNAFRRRHLKALSDLFGQVLGLCSEAGMVKLGHVAVDGTKIRANASRHKAMSYGRMERESQRLKALVQSWLDQAEAIDAAEDAEYGPNRRGDEMPSWVADKEERHRRIQEAKERLEARARQRDQEAMEREKRRTRGRPRKRPLGVPENRDQYNFTDPDSRIMKTRDGFQQCYNAQAAVDATSQVIVAHGLTDSATDQGQMIPVLETIRALTGRAPREVSADSGYCTEASLAALENSGIRGYIAIGKQHHADAVPVQGRPTRPGSLRHQMKLRLQRGGWRSRYRLRKQTVEPVFGQAKQARGFRQFFLRGIDKVPHEWALVCLAHNLLKLKRHRALRPQVTVSPA